LPDEFSFFQFILTGVSCQSPITPGFSSRSKTGIAIFSHWLGFCKILQSSPNSNFLRITASRAYLYAVFSTFPAARPQTNLGVLQIFGRESISKQNFPGQGHLVELYGSLQLIAVIFIRANPGLDFAGYFLKSLGLDV
jgi:hypothetical protein